MPDYPMNLGKPLGCCNTDVWPFNPASPSDQQYPTMHLDGVGDLPEEGTMTITFRRKEETCRTADGKETCWTCLEVKEILSVRATKSEAESDAEKNPGDHMDKMLADVESETEEED